MLIRKLDLDEFEPMGECRWQMLYPWEGVAENTPFYSGWTHLAPGQKTKKHQHHEIETYFVAYGHGVMHVEGEDVPVGPGDVIYMPPFNDHVLENPREKDEDLLFLSVFWEDLETVPESKKAREEREPGSRSLVLAPAFGGDADPLARLAGTLLPADAHARYLTLRGVETASESSTLPAAETAAELVESVSREPGGAELPEPVSALLGELLEAGHVKQLEPEPGGLSLPLGSWIEPLKRFFTHSRMSPRLRALGERRLHELEGSGEELRVSRAELATLAPWLEADADERVVFVTPGDEEWLCLGLPALLLAARRKDRLPTVMLGPEPLKPEGFTLPDGLDADVLRLYLARAWPESGPGSLDARELERTAEEVEGWNEWLSALSQRLQDEYGGKVPATGLWTEEQHQFHRRLLGRVTNLGRAYEARELSLPQVARLLSELVWDARRFAGREQHWIGVPNRSDERRTSLALELTAAKVLALGVAPLMPRFAERLRRNLGYEDALLWEEVPEWVPAGRSLAPFEAAAHL